ncbi:hypothetical protein AAG570_009409 [Ranatra chinensis]|uniref:Uncharacterized protein n=1 Tax=Ranatra chinensis TaxID=642074 RepID=A0ABD0Z641_9HEMI
MEPSASRPTTSVPLLPRGGFTQVQRVSNYKLENKRFCENGGAKHLRGGSLVAHFVKRWGCHREGVCVMGEEVQQRSSGWLSPGGSPGGAPPPPTTPYTVITSNGYPSPATMSSGSYDPYSPNGKIENIEVMDKARPPWRLITWEDYSLSMPRDYPTLNLRGGFKGCIWEEHTLIMFVIPNRFRLIAIISGAVLVVVHVTNVSSEQSSLVRTGFG